MCSDDDEPEHVYGEVYTSDAFLEIQQQIPKHSTQDIKDGIHKSVIAPIMIYSDSTNLAHFGSASLWPIYMYLGLLSQYIRSKVTAFAAFREQVTLGLCHIC